MLRRTREHLRGFRAFDGTARADCFLRRAAAFGCRRNDRLKRALEVVGHTPAAQRVRDTDPAADEREDGKHDAGYQHLECRRRQWR